MASPSMTMPITTSIATHLHKSFSVQSPSSAFFPFKFSPFVPGSSSTTRIMMSINQSHPPLPDDRIIVGCGGASMDYLVLVDGFPKPDEKIKGTSSKVQGGGNVGNALTCAARLGLRPRIIAKVAEDAEGRGMLEELEADGVDTSFVVVSKEGRSMYSYVIVDSQMKSRTAIYYPGYPPMMPADFPSTSLSSALDGARLVYFDGLSLKTALVIAEKACCRNIPILVDAEMGEEGFDKLLNMANYAVCSAKYPQPILKLEAPGIGTLSGRLLVGTAERIPHLELVDTTGAGDAFIGAVLYALCTGMPPEKMLPFAARVSAGCCRAFGARTGLPNHTDPHLQLYLDQNRNISSA